MSTTLWLLSDRDRLTDEVIAALEAPVEFGPDAARTMRQSVLAGVHSQALFPRDCAEYLLLRDLVIDVADRVADEVITLSSAMQGGGRRSVEGSLDPVRSLPPDSACFVPVEDPHVPAQWHDAIERAASSGVFEPAVLMMETT